MTDQKINLNNEVTKFLDDLKHPLRKEIELFRFEVLSANKALTENIHLNKIDWSTLFQDETFFSKKIILNLSD